jgi:hypothetical protein
MNIVFRFPIQNLFDPPLHIKVTLLRIYKDFQLYDQQILIDHNHFDYHSYIYKTVILVCTYMHTS